jgi:hypothetical protein
MLSKSDLVLAKVPGIAWAYHFSIIDDPPLSHAKFDP